MRDIAIPVAATLLLIVTVAGSFVETVAGATASPLELYVMAVARALGAS